MVAPLLKIFAVLICLSTAGGMVIHDLRIDKAAVALVSPVMYAGNEVASKFVSFSDMHTHVERNTFSQTSREPVTPNRFNETKKYLLQKYYPRGHHAFDNYHLPIV